MLFRSHIVQCLDIVRLYTRVRRYFARGGRLGVECLGFLFSIGFMGNDTGFRFGMVCPSI
jgi:hypothetical protein